MSLQKRHLFIVQISIYLKIVNRVYDLNKQGKQACLVVYAKPNFTAASLRSIPGGKNLI